jgi:CoA:oxalate CoA-transferase
MAEVSDRAGGIIRIPNPPWHFSGADAGLQGGAKYRGEDNRAVLADVLGYDSATIDDLEADGVLSSRVPSSAV